MACPAVFLFFGGQVFAVFASYAGSRSFALDGSGAWRIIFHRLYFKIPPLVCYYPLSTGGRASAPDRRYILVGVLFPAGARGMPVPVCKHNTRADFADPGMERAEKALHRRVRFRPLAGAIGPGAAAGRGFVIYFLTSQMPLSLSLLSANTRTFPSADK